MKLRNILAIIFFSTGGLLYAQDYSIKSIPDSLLEEVNYVKRIEELKIEVISPSKVRYYRKYVFTILNEKGVGYGVLAEYYDNFKSIESIDGELYNAAGIKLKSVKKKDIADVSWGEGSTLADDVRYKEHDFGFREYPYTVSYEIKSETDGLLGLPHWMPQTREGVSVVQSSLSVVYSLHNPVRYKLNLIGKPDSSTTKNGDIKLTWSVSNLVKRTPEPYQPSWYYLLPSVQLAPSFIYAQGYSGNISNWTNYGLFIYQLIKGRDALPENIIKKVHEISDRLQNKQEKIEALYRYLQESTRYISIQLGIGGWQPYDANFVGTKKYGDCKALSNYMIALLKEAGIVANYVEIEAGENAEPLQEDFPCSQANHVIVCIPNEKDTVWLECTSAYTSAGYNGLFTGNRRALLIKEDGAHIVSTSRYRSSDNLVRRKVSASIDMSGTLKANITARYTGQEQENLFGMLHYFTEAERRDYLSQLYPIASYKIEKQTHKETRGLIPVIDQELQLSAENYAVLNGKRLFITPNQFNQMGARYNTDQPRKYSIRYPYSFLNYDTISITIPSGYIIESMAKDVNISNKFGHYSIYFNVTGNTISVYREYERYTLEAPATDWPIYAKFMDDVFKGDRGKITLVKP